MMSRWIAFVALLTMATPAGLLAHPGHGTTAPESAAHFVVEPVHGLPVLLLVAVIAVTALLGRRGRTR